MKRKIVVDSSANMRAFKGVDFQSVPLKIITADREYVDDANLDVLDMAQALSTYKGKSSTACPGVGDYLDAFGDAEEVFCVTIISTLSGSYNAAMTAASQYMEEHPGRKVYVLDSYSAGPELKLAVDKMRELILQERPFEEMEKEIMAYKKKTYTLFSLESLDNLVKNGRVSALMAAAAGVLGVRVVGKASEEGTLQQLYKCRGEKKAVATLYKEMKANGYCGGKVKMDHVYNEGIAESLKKLIVADYPDAQIEVDRCGALCTFYAEVGGMIIGYEGKERE